MDTISDVAEADARYEYQIEQFEFPDESAVSDVSSYALESKRLGNHTYRLKALFESRGKIRIAISKTIE